MEEVERAVVATFYTSLRWLSKNLPHPLSRMGFVFSLNPLGNQVGFI